jgi:Arc/MetJ family transcription regulator
MRTTVTFDDEQIQRAKMLTDINETSALVREALDALIQRESARRLRALAGTEPDLRPIPRRQSEPV